MSCVLDSSVTLAWVLADETTDAIRQLFDRIAEDGASVPGLWRLEVANSLTMAARRGRIDLSFRDEALADLDMLGIEIDGQTDAHAWGSTLRIADRFRLTVYDAAYLELAVRLSLPLATLDQALRNAAIRVGVPLLGIGTP